MGAYGQSKLANILFTRELSQRLSSTPIHVYAVHPGIVHTELLRHHDTFLYKSFYCLFAKNALQGAQTTIYCAVDEKAENENGLYYS